jgi:hypothetical protein
MAKVRLSFKTPDAVDYAVEGIEDEDEREAAKAACGKWVEYGECLTVEVDTEKGTCEVVPV